ncbi:hypothetical protein BOTBODRAFT_264831 [Botryobasidium botryosum FD-172 SS1]|uniref:Uncharacterized protein n=1 Tax=Botryobasidium botryosum (strain FD-172 SS1) TaxID=930990 RepID=A0A067LV95_BOTB1|nr:hypothetical protein BOTBODRAFT_264831 [Botryobasidium botryosum FD-172 SS1]
MAEDRSRRNFMRRASIQNSHLTRFQSHHEPRSFLCPLHVHCYWRRHALRRLDQQVPRYVHPLCLYGSMWSPLQSVIMTVTVLHLKSATPSSMCAPPPPPTL